MIPTKATNKVTLALNRNYFPIGIFTARNSIRHMITENCLGLDSTMNPLDWQGWNDDAVLFPDQPCLRSAHHTWAVPTIIVLKKFSGMPTAPKKPLSRRQLFSMYDGVCQYCLQKIPFEDSTKDHVFPKSKGGTNDDFNFVLACKKCNNKKSDKLDTRNINGREVEPKTMAQLHLTFIQLGVKNRTEWDDFLFKKDKTDGHS